MATLGTVPVRILAQIGEGEPIEVGTLHLDANATAPTNAEELTRAIVTICTTAPQSDAQHDDDSHDPHACPLGHSAARCALHCNHDSRDGRNP